MYIRVYVYIYICVYVFEISIKKNTFVSLSIKRFYPYFELLYFRHGKAVWSLKLSQFNFISSFRCCSRKI